MNSAFLAQNNNKTNNNFQSIIYNDHRKQNRNNAIYLDN